MLRKYSIDYDAIKTPLNIVGKYTFDLFNVRPHIAVLPHLCSVIYRFFAGHDNTFKEITQDIQEERKRPILVNFLKICFAPLWVIDSIMALGSSIFKPEWLSYYEKPVFRVIVPKDKDQNHSNE